MPKNTNNTEVETNSSSTPTLTELFNDVSNAINNKTGKSEVIRATDFADKINDIKILNGIDEIITPETPVAYFDAKAGEPKQLDSEASGNYLINIDSESGVTETIYAGELESGFPYVYDGESLEKLDYGVYNVYNNSGTQVEPANSTTLDSSKYYYVNSDDPVYYTDDNPLQEASFTTYSGLYNLYDAEVVDGSAISEVSLNSDYVYKYNGSGRFDALSTGLYYIDNGCDGVTDISLNEGHYYYYNYCGWFQSMSEKGISSGSGYKWDGSAFDPLYNDTLYYVDEDSKCNEFYLNSTCIYRYDGSGSFTALDGNSLYIIRENDCDGNYEKVQLPTTDGSTVTIEVDGHSYEIKKLPDAE